MSSVGRLEDTERSDAGPLLPSYQSSVKDTRIYRIGCRAALHWRGAAGAPEQWK